MMKTGSIGEFVAPDPTAPSTALRVGLPASR